MINNFDSFNEELFGIDLSKIKRAAFEYHQTQECISTFSAIDSSLLSKCLDELSQLKEKYGSIDSLIKKMFTKASEQNEEVVVGYFVLSAFGAHFMIKLLNRLRKREGFGRLMASLFTTSEYDGDGYKISIPKSIRDGIISFTFIVYCFGYMVASTSKTDFIYKVTKPETEANGMYINLPFTWHGLNNFYVYDGVGKKYEFRKIEPGKFNIYLIEDKKEDKKIGTYLSDDVRIFDLKGKEIVSAVSDQSKSYKCSPVDLEMLLDDWQLKDEGHMIKTVIHKESLINENVALAKKILQSHGVDYDAINAKSDIDSNNEIIRNYTKYNRVMSFLEIKTKLVEENAIGYLGLFTKLIFSSRFNGVSYYYISSCLNDTYQQIKENRNILNRLRDDNDELKNIMDFSTTDELIRAFQRLNIWKLLNQFVRELPSKQKNLIWRDGYFLPELKSKHKFLKESICEILQDRDLKNLFLKKVSRIKTVNEFVETLSRIVKKEPWEFDYWLNKLENTRNVYVTWADKEQKQIICMVFSWMAVRKVAGMTNWCIVSHILNWRKYYSKGSQCILYDFNRTGSQYDSVVGFTLESVGDSYRMTDCHDKNDAGYSMDRKFREGGSFRTNNIDPKYLQLDLKKAILKLDSTTIRAFKNSFSNLLKSKYISKFLDFYD